jgi:hypothetical protein
MRAHDRLNSAISFSRSPYEAKNNCQFEKSFRRLFTGSMSRHICHVLRKKSANGAPACALRSIGGLLEILDRSHHLFAGDDPGVHAQGAKLEAFLAKEAAGPMIEPAIAHVTADNVPGRRLRLVVPAR